MIMQNYIMQNYIIHPNLATIFRSEVHYLMIFHKPETMKRAPWVYDVSRVTS